MLTPLEFAGFSVALLAGIWAGLLALSEESPAVARTLGDMADSDAEAQAPYQTIHVARLSLLFVSGLAASLAIRWWERPVLEGLGVGAVSVGFLFMISEALPRAVGALAPEVAAASTNAARRSAVPFGFFRDLAGIIERWTRSVLPKRVSEEHTNGSVKRELLLGVFSLGDTTVAEIMTPRLDVLALDIKADLKEALDLVSKGEHSRIPVYRETLDNVAGILYAKDLVGPVAGVAELPDKWQDLIRPAQFVPESKSLAAQLRDFQRGRAHLAVVVDEFGGTSGLVTLEDTLEEIVGEIRDEYDVDEVPAVEREGDDKFWVDGGVTVDELSALLGINAEREEVATVGGFVYAELGHVPAPGEEFYVDHYRVVVEQVVRRRVRRVYFERQDGRPQPETMEESPK